MMEEVIGYKKIKHTKIIVIKKVGYRIRRKVGWK